MATRIFERDTPDGFLSDEIVGNFILALAPEKKGLLLGLAGSDKRAKVYTLAVYPTTPNPKDLYQSVGTGAIITPQFSAAHRVEITYGLGGQGSESLVLDLRRGIKLSLPLSAIKVEVTNALSRALITASGGNPNDDIWKLSVGASIAPGASSNNDGATTTLTRRGAIDGPINFAAFAIPPHAKDVSFFVSDSAAVPPLPMDVVTEFSTAGNAGAPHDYGIVANYIAAPVAMPIGPLLIPGQAAYAAIAIMAGPGVLAPALATYNITAVFRLNI